MVVAKGEGSIFSDRLVEILVRKGKNQLKENQTAIADKLRKQERLTNNEFWSVYASIRKEGPAVRYANAQNVANDRERTLNATGKT